MTGAWLRGAPWIVASVWFVSCATTASQVQLDRLQASARQADRAIGDLDVTGDGVLSEADRLVFASLATDAERRGASLSGWSYLGRDRSNVFGGVRATADGMSLDGLTTPSLRELFVETRWAALQIRALLAGGAAARPKNTVGGSLRHLLPGYNADTMTPAALCAGIAAATFDSLAAAGVPRIAVFDLDSTIWAGNITDAFLLAVAGSGKVSATAAADLRAYVAGLPDADVSLLPDSDVLAHARVVHRRLTDTSLPTAQQLNMAEGFFRIMALIKGLTPADLAPLVAQVIEAGVDDYRPWLERVYASPDGCGMGEIIAALRARGVDAYVMTATLDVLAYAASVRLGIPQERVRASVPQLDSEGRYTGALAEEVYYTKVATLWQWLPAAPLFVFGDSAVSDFDMLREALVAGFMINPRLPVLVRDSTEAAGRLVALHFDRTRGALAPSPPRRYNFVNASLAPVRLLPDQRVFRDDGLRRNHE